MGPTDYFKFLYGSNIFKDPILPRKKISYTGFLMGWAVALKLAVKKRED
jgi:hypothetical protein